MPFVVGGNQSVDTAYDVSNSFRFDGDNDFFSKTFGTATSRKTWTYSFWVKRAKLGTQQCFLGADAGGGTNNNIRFRADNAITFFAQGGGSDTYFLNTNQVFRDTSAWYHLVFGFDSTQSTSTNRLKMYVNGTEVTSFASSQYPSLNFDDTINSNVEHEIGRRGSGNMPADFYMAEIHFIDGTSKLPTDFGEFNDNGVWIPKEYNGSYGNNGFYLEFKQSGDSANSSGKGADTSGNDNHFASNNMSGVLPTTDTCTNNFATLNPLNIRLGIGITFAEGNLQVEAGASSGTAGAFSTIAGLKRGKWYAEFKPTTVNNSGILRFGIEDTDFNAADGLCNVAASAYASNGNKGRNATDTSHGDSYDDNDIIGVAVDLDNGAIYFSKNGTWQNSSDPESGSSKTGAAFTDILTILPDGGYMFAFNFNYSGGEQDVVQANFGNPVFSISSGNSDGNGYGNFEYAVPSGYYSLCTKNLAEFG